MDIAFKTDVLNLDDPTDNILPANFSAKPQYRFFVSAPFLSEARVP